MFSKAGKNMTVILQHRVIWKLSSMTTVTGSGMMGTQTSTLILLSFLLMSGLELQYLINSNLCHHYVQPGPMYNQVLVQYLEDAHTQSPI